MYSAKYEKHTLKWKKNTSWKTTENLLMHFKSSMECVHTKNKPNERFNVMLGFTIRISQHTYSFLFIF